MEQSNIEKIQNYAKQIVNPEKANEDITEKEMYHELAKKIRPDLVENDDFAKRLNEAKDEADQGDPAKLKGLYEEFKDEDIGARVDTVV
jgi:hypothetical protein